MSPARKRPICHTCNTPMAGHKRPLGIPICPAFPVNQDFATAKDVTPPIDNPRLVIPTLTAGDVFHYINPNYIERNRPPSIPDRERPDSPMTWVSTEIADDIPVKREPVTIPTDFQLNQRIHVERVERIERYERSNSVASSVTSSSGYIQRLKQALSTSSPLASMFRTPRQDISAVTRAARAEGLYTALVRNPFATNGEVEAIAPTSQHGGWKVVVGMDAGTVAELADLYERNALGALGQQDEPPRPTAWQSWVATFTVKCAIAGFTLWVFLWAFLSMV